MYEMTANLTLIVHFAFILFVVFGALLFFVTTKIVFIHIPAFLWGIHLGMTQGLLLAMISKLSPLELRGTSFGLFHAISGVALLTASLIAGYLWQYYNSGLIFFVSAIITLVGITTFFLWYWCYFIKIKKK